MILDLPVERGGDLSVAWEVGGGVTRQVKALHRDGSVDQWDGLLLRSNLSRVSLEACPKPGGQIMNDLLNPCRLCPRSCTIDRRVGQRGPCGVADRPWVSRYGLSYSEEGFLSGTAGSGMIWLTGCNMGCVFCQNYDFNLELRGFEITVPRLSDIHLELQAMGCHNVNWVTPTHQAPFLVEALQEARGRGFDRPVVYNCGGYEPVEVLERLAGCVDVYLPDFKYWDADRAQEVLKVRNYPETCRQALLEMHLQVGDLQVGSDGLATRGLAIRHLLMPDRLDDVEPIARWIAENLGPGTMFNVMPQYMPFWKAGGIAGLERGVTVGEWRRAIETCRRQGLTNLWITRIPEDALGTAAVVSPEAVQRLGAR